MRKAIAAVAATVLACCSIIVWVSQNNEGKEAAAAIPLTTVKTLDEVPAGEIFLDNLTYDNAQISFGPGVNGQVIDVVDNKYTPARTYHYIRINKSYGANSTTTLTSPMKITFLNAGHTVKGRSVDLTLQYDKVIFKSRLASEFIYIGIFNRIGGDEESPFAFFYPVGQVDI